MRRVLQVSVAREGDGLCGFSESTSLSLVDKHATTTDASARDGAVT